LVLAGLPCPVPQHPVETRDGVLHPDLVWPEYRVALEYDGAYHGEPNRLDLDRRRLNRLVTQGWIVLHATRQHLGREFDTLVNQVWAALRSRGWNPAATSGKLSP
jgi:very-short-patch-repair endonuclease